MKLLLLIVLSLTCYVTSNVIDDEERQDIYHKHEPFSERSSYKEVEDSEFWYTSAQDMLKATVQQKNVEKEAKNVIFYLGDGMSLPTIVAARTLKGELEKLNFKEDGALFFEGFPNVALSKTYCSDAQVADSACSATAYLTGTKANSGTIGVKPSVKLMDCEGMMDVDQQSLSALAWAQAAGKSTGVVTTTRITHASPSGTYAHTAHRDWENDAAIKDDGQDPTKCDDIAEQLILKEPGKNINVIFGGGRREFTPNNVADPDETGKMGRRTDGQNLIETWKTMKADQGDKASYIYNRDEFEKLDTTKTEFVLGLFNYDHLDFVLDSKEDPSLSELVQKAIEILSKNPKGFFLFVEGGRIDHAHHDGKAQKALTETIEFDNAVKVGASMTSEEDTLILVTADHAHVMTIAGYPDRNNSILGIAEISDEDNLPYTTLSYANGPGYNTHPHDENGRYNLTDDDFFNKDYHQPATVPLGMESHGGDDVIIYSRGPFSHLLRGVVQQNYIPHVIGYASATSPWLKYAPNPDDNQSTTPSGSTQFKSTFSATFIATLVAIYVLYQ